MRASRVFILALAMACSGCGLDAQVGELAVVEADAPDPARAPGDQRLESDAGRPEADGGNPVHDGGSPATADAGSPRPYRLVVMLIDAMDLRVLIARGLRITDDVAKETRHMQAVLERANQLGVPVFETEYLRAGPTQPALAALRGPNWRLIRKGQFSAFEGTDLETQLRSLGATHLVLMGFNQIACVKATTEDAKDLGYRMATSFEVLQGWNESGVRTFYAANTWLVGPHTQLPVFRPTLGQGGYFSPTDGGW